FHSCNSLSIEKTHYYTISYRIFRVGVLMNFLIDESSQSAVGLPTGKGRFGTSSFYNENKGEPS
ncbi:hypothetical protein, partial [Algoriphagus faecimaris]|uniref:hypothetical protein n=1 Tax=Algoriphagus faecimaris TaxID=686796 RepID=UPI00196A6C38